MGSWEDSHSLGSFPSMPVHLPPLNQMGAAGYGFFRTSPTRSQLALAPSRTTALGVHSQD